MRLRLFEPADAAQEGYDGSWPACGITALDDDGNIMGYGGVQVWKTRRWVFLKVLDERLRRPHFLHRIILRGLEASFEGDMADIFATCDETKPRAREWLARLGFRELTEGEKNDEIREVEAVANQRAWVREEMQHG